MGVFLFILLILFLAALVIVPVVVIYSRRQAREQKNYERGLKMVPLLIHLPPVSEDIDANGRDNRDLVDENISKAQVIYNIIASTYEKGFKRKLYGQQHIAFEIISSQGFVYFYTTVPLGLVEVVRQAIVSAYPAARLEEAEEHNIFNVASKSSGTTGGELVLRESFAYPINTYLDLKRDSMQGILNALATVGKEDGAAIQILLRPADPSWRRTAHGIAAAKRKGEDASNEKVKAVGGLFKDVGTALYKPPEAKDGNNADKPQLSDMELQVLNAIDEKTRYPAYEVLIRIVASSNLTGKSQNILSAIVSAFSEFNSQEKNSFKYEPATDVDELATAYIMRFFPQQNNKMILNSVELASIFHFPDQRSIPTTQLERQDSKQTDGPRNMPEEGTLLGYNVFRGVKKPIRLSVHDRQRHMYVVGQTGTGKSTYLENLALQDMMAGNGFAFVDPHGDTAEKILSMVPKDRTEDVIYFCPAEMEFPMGLNLFETHNTDQKDFIIQEVLNMLYKLYDPQHQGIMGPRYEDMFRNAALAVMADPEGGTFIEIPQLFRDPQFLKQKLQHVKDQTVLDFWQKQFPASQRSNEAGEVTAWFVSKFGAFLSNEMMRNIIGQTKSSFDLRDIMDNKKILLVNLSKGRTGDLNSKLLGMIFVMKFQAAAMSRANIPESQRVDFSLYVDEFQNFSTDSFATIMSEARKYHLNLIVANQFTTQLTEEIRDAVFGNMGTIVAFRIGQNDVDSLSRYFQPVFDGDDLLRVPNYNTIVRTLVGGVPTQPFSMATLPPLGDPNSKLSDALKQLSAAKYGKPKAMVERDIFARIRTTPAAPATGGMMPPAAAAPANRPFGASPWQTPRQGAGPISGSAAQAPGAGYGYAQQPQPATAFGQQLPAGGSMAPPPYGGAQFAGAASSQPSAPSYAGAGTAQPKPAAGASFLDEWLAKKSSNPSQGQVALPAQQPPVGTSPPTPPPAQQAWPDEPSVAAPVPPSIVKHDANEMMPSKANASDVMAQDSGNDILSNDETPSRDTPNVQSDHDEVDQEADASSKKRRRRKRKQRDGESDSDYQNGSDREVSQTPAEPKAEPGLMQLQHDAADLQRLEVERAKRRREEVRQAQIELKTKFNRDAKPASRPPEPSQSLEKPLVAETSAVEPVIDPSTNDDRIGEALANDATAKMEESSSDQPVSNTVALDGDNMPILKVDTRRAEDELSHGDTIYIDKDGNLKLVEVPELGGKSKPDDNKDHDEAS